MFESCRLVNGREKEFRNGELVGKDGITIKIAPLFVFVSGFSLLPPFQFNELSIPGSIARLLCSIGNIASILAISGLGQGIGYSLFIVVWLLLVVGVFSW